VLADQLWHSRFGSGPAIVGTQVTLNGTRRTAIGVMPPGFEFPAKAAAWTPHVIKICGFSGLRS
jgi:hypothetical protein